MLTILSMKNEFIKEDVLKKLGGMKKAVAFFKCKPQAIYMWPEGHPIPKQRQLECMLYKPEIFGSQSTETC